MLWDGIRNHHIRRSGTPVYGTVYHRHRMSITIRERLVWMGVHAVPAEFRTVELAHRVIGSGPPLMLVAGTGYPGATWPADFVRPLAERCTVITIDHRGTGASPRTDDRYSTRLFAADAIALLDRLQVESAHVLGHSMGGRVAQWMALDAAPRVGSLILAASGPGHFDDSQPQTRGIPVAAALKLIELGYEEYMRTLITTSFFTPEFVDAHPERVQWLVEAFWSNRPPLEHYLRHVAARQEHQTTAQLPQIEQPTLVVVGDRDTRVGGTGSHWDQSRYLAENLPNAEFRAIAGARHGYFWSAPADTVDLLREWIGRHEHAARHSTS